MAHLFAEDIFAGAPSFPQYQVPIGMHVENREKLIHRLRAIHAAATGFVLVQGGQTVEQYDTDHELVFRQESNFQYLFGIPEPDSLGGIDIATGKAFFFAPKRDPAWAVWCGEMYEPASAYPYSCRACSHALESYKKNYHVDEVYAFEYQG